MGGYSVWTLRGSVLNAALSEYRPLKGYTKTARRGK